VGGIVTGLNAVGPGAHFVVACDMPGVDVQVLTLLMEAVDPTLDAVVPELSGMPEPLCAVYCDSAEVKLRRFLADGGRSARGALDVLATLRIEEDRLRRLDPTARSLINVNTPEDLDRFREGITWRGNGA
jgi:molybdopterin-guanine dinucleotide biosynthesis protein A